ncbi:MAG: ribosome modulation factor, partial [Janthinobacterium lividum]
FEAGFSANIHAVPLSDCPYVRTEHAEMWRKGWKAGWTQML